MKLNIFTITAPGVIKLNAVGKTRKSVNARTGRVLLNSIITFILDARDIAATINKSPVIDNMPLRRAADTMNKSAPKSLALGSIA